jgi:hypothetical protein
MRNAFTSYVGLLCGLVGLAAVASVVASGAAEAQSGLLTKGTDLPPITLSAMQPLAEKPYELQAGKYYRLTIKSDGSDDLAIGGAEFFRNVWINEIEVEDVSIKPIGLDSISLEGESEAEISFIPIRPGSFILRIPGTTGESQAATFNVK